MTSARLTRQPPRGLYAGLLRQPRESATAGAARFPGAGSGANTGANTGLVAVAGAVPGVAVAVSDGAAAVAGGTGDGTATAGAARAGSCVAGGAERVVDAEGAPSRSGAVPERLPVALAPPPANTPHASVPRDAPGRSKAVPAGVEDARTRCASRSSAPPAKRNATASSTDGKPCARPKRLCSSVKPIAVRRSTAAPCPATAASSRSRGTGAEARCSAASAAADARSRFGTADITSVLAR